MMWQLSVPDIEVYPIQTPIPYQLHIEVLSTSKKGAPPTVSASSLVGIEMSVVRNVDIIAHTKRRLLAPEDRKSTRLNSSHSGESRMPSSA